MFVQPVVTTGCTTGWMNVCTMQPALKTGHTTRQLVVQLDALCILLCSLKSSIACAMQHQFLQSVIFTLQRGNFAPVVFSMLHMDIAGLAIILLSCDYQLHCKNNVNNLFTCRTLYCTLLCIIMYFVSIIEILVCLKGFSSHLWPCIFL